MKKKTIKIIAAAFMIAAMIACMALPAFAWGNVVGGTYPGTPGQGYDIYSVYNMADLSYIKTNTTDGGNYIKVNQATMNTINLLKSNGEVELPQTQSSGLVTTTVNAPETEDDAYLTVDFVLSPRQADWDIDITAAFSCEYRDMKVIIANGSPLDAFFNLPRFKFWSTNDQPFYDVRDEEYIPFVYDLRATYYNANGQELYSDDLYSQPCKVLQTDTYHYEFSPFLPMLDSLPDSVYYIAIHRVCIYPRAYDAFVPHIYSPEYTISVPYQREHWSTSDYMSDWVGMGSLYYKNELDDVHSTYQAEIAAKDAELEAKDDKILALEQNNFELQNSNAIDEFFTGISSSIWNGIGEISDLGYSYTDSSGTLQKVTIGGLITVAVVGVVAIFVIKLIRGG